MEELLGNLCNDLIAVIQQTKVYIPDIPFNSKTQIIKFILITQKREFLTDIKAMPAAEFNFKLGQEGYKGLGNLTDDLTLTIIDR